MPPQSSDRDALLLAVNRSAERLQTLWFTFLAVSLYLAIAALTTTHRMLLLEEGQTLPLLNVKLPLLPFYTIAPAFYVLLHAYFLIMLVLLARTARTFETDTLVHDISDRYRMRIENAIFIQIISGAWRERKGTNGRVLQAIAIVTIIAIPVIVVLLFQVVFLAYHSEAITWWHRSLILIDLVVIWALWPSYRYEGGERLFPRFRTLPRLTLSLASSMLVVGFSLFVATFPYESMYLNPIEIAMPSIKAFIFGNDRPILDDPGVQFRYVLTDQKTVPEKFQGIFPNRLILSSEDLVDDDKLKKLLLDNAFSGERRPAFILDLSRRNLVGAVLDYADLRSIKFERTDLRDASLQGAWLQGSWLDYADLRGVDMRWVQLQDARLRRANAAAANLNGANLMGAVLEGVILLASDLNEAKLQGVNLQGADLRGSSLFAAHLEGAVLYMTDLSGAYMQDANLLGVRVEYSTAWRILGNPKAGGLETDFLPWSVSVAPPYGDGPNEYSEWINKSVSFPPERWIASINLEVKRREVVLARLAVLSPSAERKKARAGDGIDIVPDFASVSLWNDETETVAERTRIGEKLYSVACQRLTAPHMIRGMIRNGRFANMEEVLGRFSSDIEAAQRGKPDEQLACPAARMMTEGDVGELCSRTFIEHPRQPGIPTPHGAGPFMPICGK